MQTAVVKESLRITALVTSRLPLTSPNEHLRYKGWDIPPHVSPLDQGLHKNERQIVEAFDVINLH